MYLRLRAKVRKGKNLRFMNLCLEIRADLPDSITRNLYLRTKAVRQHHHIPRLFPQGKSYIKRVAGGVVKKQYPPGTGHRTKQTYSEISIYPFAFLFASFPVKRKKEINGRCAEAGPRIWRHSKLIPYPHCFFAFLFASFSFPVKRKRRESNQRSTP